MSMLGRSFRVGVIASCLLAGTVGASRAAPANTLDEFYAALSACGHLPSPSPAWADSVLTLRFSLHSDGSLAGPPHVAYQKPTGSAEVQKAFRAAVLAAMARCFPLPVSDGLGVVVAGRMIAFSITGTGPGDIRIQNNR